MPFRFACLEPRLVMLSLFVLVLASAAVGQTTHPRATTQTGEQKASPVKEVPVSTTPGQAHSPSVTMPSTVELRLEKLPTIELKVPPLDLRVPSLDVGSPQVTLS